MKDFNPVIKRNGSQLGAWIFLQEIVQSNMPTQNYIL
jgi:hypothetical protein